MRSDAKSPVDITSCMFSWQLLFYGISAVVGYLMSHPVIRIY